MRLRWVLAFILVGCEGLGNILDDEGGGGDNGGSGAGDGNGPNGESGNPQFPGAGSGDGSGFLPGSHLWCYYSDQFPDGPAASVEYVFEPLSGTDTIRVRLIFHPGFVDNTYGVNSIGWPSRGGKGHTFEMLWRSDHAIIMMRSGGQDRLGMKIDYIHMNTAASSGWGTLGVMGGDGGMELGDASGVLQTMTSLDRNLNERGYSQYTVDSPATDEMWSPNPATPDWDYRVVYEAWVAASVLGGAAIDPPRMDYVHASPSKFDEDTLIVEQGECPPDWFCDNPDGCDGGTGEVPPPGDTGPPQGDESGMCIPSEYGEGCFNGRDDDCDGLADCDDSGCDAKCCTTTDECAVGEVCTDGMCVTDGPID